MKRRIHIGFWSIVVICATLIIIVAMLTDQFHKLVEAIKQIP